MGAPRTYGDAVREEEGRETPRKDTAHDEAGAGEERAPDAEPAVPDGVQQPPAHHACGGKGHRRRQYATHVTSWPRCACVEQLELRRDLCSPRSPGNDRDRRGR